MDSNKLASSHRRHEIRNKLNNISVNAELAKLQMLQNADPNDVVTSIDKIISACSECATILNDNDQHG